MVNVSVRLQSVLTRICGHSNASVIVPERKELIMHDVPP